MGLSMLSRACASVTGSSAELPYSDLRRRARTRADKVRVPVLTTCRCSVDTAGALGLRPERGGIAPCLNVVSGFVRGGRRREDELSGCFRGSNVVTCGGQGLAKKLLAVVPRKATQTYCSCPVIAGIRRPRGRGCVAEVLTFFGDPLTFASNPYSLSGGRPAADPRVLRCLIQHPSYILLERPFPRSICHRPVLAPPTISAMGKRGEGPMMSFS